MASQEQLQDVFKRLKPICVPLLGSSLLSPTSVSNVSNLLDDLRNVLLDVKASGLVLTPNLISYTFFPLSNLLRRNTASDIPDQILEKVFLVLAILCEDWWWDFDLAVWEQIFMLCGAVIAGIEAKGKGRDRDDETKEAAGRCLLALLRPRTPEEDPSTSPTSSNRAQARLEIILAHARTAKFLPILGQTLDSLLVVVDTPHLPLQRVCLEILSLIIGTYAPDDIIPSVLPGVASRTTRIALGTSTTKGWANGETVAGALNIMQFAIVRAIGDDICAKEGAINIVVDLEDLAQSPPNARETSLHETRAYATPRTPSWLRGTSSQLLIALNTLSPLVSHPTPSALLALSKFSATVIGATSMTLPDAQPLLLHFLLSLSNSDFPSVAAESRGSLLSLLTTASNVQHRLQQTLLRTTSDNLLALPRLLLTHADAKVEHVVGIIEAVCRLLALTGEAKLGLASISTGIGKLLGPTGGIEKWGWSLLSVLELTEPPITLSHASSARLMLESNPDEPQWVPFPDVQFRNVFSTSARNALERMFRSLGRAGEDRCLFSVEWFASVGRSGTGSNAITATWCACRLLEGVAGISLSQGGEGEGISTRPSKRLTKLARGLARSIAELWEESHEADQHQPEPTPVDEHHSSANVLVQHVKGVDAIHETLRITRPSAAKEVPVTKRPGLHRALSLQLLAVSAGILQTQFTSLLIHTLYPVLRSLVSSDVYLASTALATLNYITVVMSYASPANLLLSNFDYALDGVSRRLSHRWLDVEATKVLALLVRLVGGDIVERAGDVVETCFDRLDEFHGYGVIVEGLVEVLEDVVKAIREDVEATPSEPTEPSQEPAPEPGLPTSINDFFHWYSHRHDKPAEDVETTDYGPAPRRAWGEEKSCDVDTKEEDLSAQEPDLTAEPPPTPIQALTKQIVSRSLYFLTHGSPVIRARILSLLAASVSVLPESALLPSIHHAWPFVLNRLTDPEPFVVSAAAYLVESLATHVGSFMFRRVWDDVWPKFRVLLQKLDVADATSALSRRGPGAVGTESAYTHSHRLYRSVIRTMTAAVKGVQLQETSTWQLLLAFRRFLHQGAHEELQHCARELYIGVGEKNPDAVWLVLTSTMEGNYAATQFLKAPHWDIRANATAILQALNHDSATQ
ncbi:putative HEAT repeat protein [Lyophyllum shimeji]|uniref:HEAT repeat protein n=1 Tax=Lyophyllum shimeji TaxID=47721 RepID=A0A9P3UIQ5_LYOSH|nr:putative HEAT repeat protein [Lyophyllum shimeji]